MGWMRKGLLGTAAVVAIVAGVVVVKFMAFTPPEIADGSAIKLAASPAFEIASATGHLSQAVQFQTVSHQDQADNRIEEWKKLQDWLQASYPAVHRATERELVDGATLIHRWQGSDPSLPAIIVMAHQDVVPVTPGTEKDWKYPPFSGAIAEGAVWGRGTVDDKGSLVALFEALDALARAGFTPRRTVYLVSGHNEEVLGSGAKVAAATLAARKVRALFTIDEGGAIISDAPIINAPAIFIGVAEKGYGTLKITANAKGGHSSMPPAETGVVHLAKAILAINDAASPIELRGPAGDMLAVLGAQKGGMTKVAVANPWLFGSVLKKQVSANPATKAAFHTTTAPTMLQGSPKENVLPQSANGLINFRIAPWDSSAGVMARAKSAVGDLPVNVDWVKPPNEPSPVSSYTSTGWQMIAAAARAGVPNATLTPYLVVGGTDSRNFQSISDDVYRFMPMQFTNKESAMIHGTNEHMTIKNFERMIQFYAQLIATAAG